MARVIRGLLGLAVCVATLGVVPAGAMAGSISGTVTAENGGAPIAGVEVCPRREPYTVETDCTVTDGSGGYSLSYLPEGSYMLYFSANPANLKYVSEFYDNKRHSWEVDLVPIAWNQNLTGLNVQLAEGGSISGVVTEEGSGNPIAGVRVCANDDQGIEGRCSSSGPTGEYRLNGLRSNEYTVEFDGGNTVSYLREFYEDAASWAEAEKLEVEAPNLLSGIDATLAPGAQILGHVSDIRRGGPAFDVMVCAEAQVGEFQACDWSDIAGDYALRSLPAGTYIVGFGIEYLPFGRWAWEWWQGVSLRAEATPIEIEPPDVRTGIDGQAVGQYRGSSEPPPEGEPFTFAPRPSKQPPAKCRKGFHRKKIGGRSRCVKKHKKTHLHKPRKR